MNTAIAPLESKHIDMVVAMHKRAFPNFFLTFLGPRFLKEFYNSFLDDPTGIGMVVEDVTTGNVLGAVVGTLQPAGFFGRLVRRRWWAFSIAASHALPKSVLVAPRLFRALFYRGNVPLGPPRALLSSIAVSPEARGLGLGRALKVTWVNEVRRRGKVKGCYLTTDAENNESVNRFYQDGGWKLESSFVTPEGRRMYRYVLDFEKESDHPVLTQ